MLMSMLQILVKSMISSSTKRPLGRAFKKWCDSASDKGVELPLQNHSVACKLSYPFLKCLKRDVLFKVLKKLKTKLT